MGVQRCRPRTPVALFLSENKRETHQLFPYTVTRQPDRSPPPGRHSLQSRCRTQAELDSERTTHCPSQARQQTSTSHHQRCLGHTGPVLHDPIHVVFSHIEKKKKVDPPKHLNGSEALSVCNGRYKVHCTVEKDNIDLPRHAQDVSNRA